MNTLIQGGDIVAYHDGTHRLEWQGQTAEELAPTSFPSFPD